MVQFNDNILVKTSQLLHISGRKSEVKVIAIGY